MPNKNEIIYLTINMFVFWSSKKRLANQLIDPLADVIGDVKRIGKSVVLSSLPLSSLYIIDLMIYPSVAASVLRLLSINHFEGKNQTFLRCSFPMHWGICLFGYFTQYYNYHYYSNCNYYVNSQIIQAIIITFQWRS